MVKVNVLKSRPIFILLAHPSKVVLAKIRIFRSDFKCRIPSHSNAYLHCAIICWQLCLCLRLHSGLHGVVHFGSDWLDVCDSSKSVLLRSCALVRFEYFRHWRVSEYSWQQPKGWRDIISREVAGFPLFVSLSKVEVETLRLFLKVSRRRGQDAARFTTSWK